MSENTNSRLPEEGKWTKQKNKLKQKFSSLTDQDLEFEPGQMAMMFEKLKKKLGKSKEEMHKVIEYLSKLL